MKRTWLQRRLKPKKFKGVGVDGPTILAVSSAGGLWQIDWAWIYESPSEWQIRGRFKDGGVWTEYEDVAFPTGPVRTFESGFFPGQTDAQLQIRASFPFTSNYTISQEFPLFA